MSKSCVAFKVLDEDEKVPIGYKWIKCHLRLDTKMDLCDIGNAYLNTFPHANLSSMEGPEFGAELQGMNIVRVRALYSLKSS
jgi:hypothetical protein